MTTAAIPRRARGPVARLVSVIRWEGLAGLRWRALAALGYRRQHWFARPLTDPLPAPSEPSGVDLCFLGEEDANDYLALRRGATGEQFRARLQSGHCCSGVRVDGRLLAVHWVAAGSAWSDYLGRTLDFPADEVYFYDVYTGPAARGQRLQDLNLRRSLSHHRSQGAAWALALIVPENRPSVRCFERIGFRRAGTMTALRFGSWRWHRQRGARRPDGKGDRGRQREAPGGR